MKSIIVALIIVLVAAAGIVFALGTLRRRDQKPLGEAPTLSVSDMSQVARQEFLDHGFTIVKDLRLLPQRVLDNFTEYDGMRLVIANPGKEFIDGDVIYDNSVPRERLIFAGTSAQRCFVYYERGGRGHAYLLALFEVTPTDAKPVWQGYCTGPAASPSDLRSACH